MTTFETASIKAFELLKRSVAVFPVRGYFGALFNIEVLLNISNRKKIKCIELLGDLSSVFD